MNAMVDANSNYPSADEIAQALNDGERYKIAIENIQANAECFFTRGDYEDGLIAVSEIAAEALKESTRE